MDNGSEQLHLYFEMYKEYRLEMRHQETQRAAVSGTCVALAGALIGLAFHDGTTWARPYLGLLLVSFGLVSIAILRKFYERFKLARARAMAFLRAMQERTPPGCKGIGTL